MTDNDLPSEAAVSREEAATALQIGIDTSTTVAPPQSSSIAAIPDAKSENTYSVFLRTIQEQASNFTKINSRLDEIESVIKEKSNLYKNLNKLSVISICNLIFMPIILSLVLFFAVFIATKQLLNALTIVYSIIGLFGASSIIDAIYITVKIKNMEEEVDKLKK